MLKLQSIVGLLLLPSMGVGFAPSVRPAVVRNSVCEGPLKAAVSPNIAE
jgi:hypothetical protein